MEVPIRAPSIGTKMQPGASLLFLRRNSRSELTNWFHTRGRACNARNDRILAQTTEGIHTTLLDRQDAFMNQGETERRDKR